MKSAQQQDNSLLNINLSNARSENESYEDYRTRLAINKKIVNTYRTMGRDAFREMFPGGVAGAIDKATSNANVNADQEPNQPVAVTGSLHLSTDE